MGFRFGMDREHAAHGGQVTFACANFSKALGEEDGGRQVAGLPLEALLQLLSSESLQASSELHVAQATTVLSALKSNETVCNQSVVRLLLLDH